MQAGAGPVSSAFVPSTCCLFLLEARDSPPTFSQCLCRAYRISLFSISSAIHPSIVHLERGLGVVFSPSWILSPSTISRLRRCLPPAAPPVYQIGSAEQEPRILIQCINVKVKAARIWAESPTTSDIDAPQRTTRVRKGQSLKSEACTLSSFHSRARRNKRMNELDRPALCWFVA